MSNPLRALPAVERLVGQVKGLKEPIPHPILVRSAREVLSRWRSRIRAGAPPPSERQLVEEIVQLAKRRRARSLTRAVNATGVVLNTSLGRAVLPEAARQALQEIAAGHSTLEIERQSGRRGSRQDHVRSLLKELTGAEEALVVNNNAAAIFLCIHTLAAGREVVISRGQLVEIGGSFRLPDILRHAGAKLVEVGTTNRTRLSDYADAITSETALILRCHPSNFKIIGFTEEVTVEELVALGREKGVPVMDDVGSGCLLETTRLGLPPEPTLRGSLQTGCDLVTGSGDKLLGGPQAGLILGRTELLARIQRNPIARVVRPDKLTLAALEATLRLYQEEPERALEAIPTWRYLTRRPEPLKRMANRLRVWLYKHLNKGEWEFRVVATLSEVGGGSLPGVTLPSFALALHRVGWQPERLAHALREADPPIFARIEQNRVLLDMRTLEEEELKWIQNALCQMEDDAP